MRHAVMMTWMTFRALPNRRQVLPRAARKVAGAVMVWLDRRREAINRASAPVHP